VTSVYPKPLRRLVLLLSRLPGIGEKTATRLAFFVLRQPEQLAHDLAAAVPMPVMLSHDCADALTEVGTRNAERGTSETGSSAFRVRRSALGEGQG